MNATHLNKISIVMRYLIALLLFAFALPCRGQREQEKLRYQWSEIEIAPGLVQTNRFRAFIAIPRDADSLLALFAADTAGSVRYSPDGYGATWLQTFGLEQVTVTRFEHTRINGLWVYACTDSGLYRTKLDSSQTQPLQWRRVGTEWPYDPIVAVAFAALDETLGRTIYAATEDEIFRYSASQPEWQPLPNASKSSDFHYKITGLAVSPFKKQESLIVGSDAGIYQVPIVNDSLIWPASQLKGSSTGLTNFAVVIGNDSISELVALNAKQAIFYSSKDGDSWWSFGSHPNDMLRQYHVFHSLTVDQYLPTKSVFVTTSEGRVWRYRLRGVTVGFLKMVREEISSWETILISRRLQERMFIPEIVNIVPLSFTFDKSSNLATILNPRKGKGTKTNQYMAESGRINLRNCDKILWSKAINVTQAIDEMIQEPIQHKIEVEIRVFTRNASGHFSQTKYPKSRAEWRSGDYYPKEVDRLADEVMLGEFGIRKTREAKPPWILSGWRPYVLGATGLGTAAWIGSMLGGANGDDNGTREPERLPAPPRFP